MYTPQICSFPCGAGYNDKIMSAQLDISQSLKRRDPCTEEDVVMWGTCVNAGWTVNKQWDIFCYQI
jgi:hypothetical protein